MDDLPHESERRRLLLICFLCSPARGSEHAVGWNRAVQAARFHDTWVICSAGPAETEIREYEAKHGKIPGLTFVFLPRSSWFSRVVHFPGAYYMLYRRWQKRAYEVAAGLHEKIRFDLIHHVNLCGFREPGFAWKLDVPFVWGPWGGTNNFPRAFLKTADRMSATQESLRTIVNKMQLRFSSRVRRAADKATVLMATNTDTRDDFIRAGLPTPEVVPCTGVSKLLGSPRSWSADGRPLRLLWSGVLRSIKGMPLFLNALAKIPDVPVEVRVCGDGPERRRLETLASRLGVAERIRWLGWIPHKEALEQYSWADLFVFTSLRDTFPTVILEAFSSGLPVVALNHQGMKDIVTLETGFKLAVESPEQVSSDLARTIAGLRGDREAWERMSAAAVARAEKFLWPRLGEQMAEIYQRVLGEAPQAAAISRPALSRRLAGGVAE